MSASPVSFSASAALCSLLLPSIDISHGVFMGPDGVLAGVQRQVRLLSFVLPLATPKRFGGQTFSTDRGFDGQPRPVALDGLVQRHQQLAQGRETSGDRCFPRMKSSLPFHPMGWLIHSPPGLSMDPSRTSRTATCARIVRWT